MGSAEFVDVDRGRLVTIGSDDPAGELWFATWRPWPPAAAPDDPVVEAIGSLDAVVAQLERDQGLVLPIEVRQVLTLPEVRLGDQDAKLWAPHMIGAPPWEVGTESQRWAGYLDQEHFDPSVGQGVLRNLVGATTYDQLRVREDAFVAARGTSLHTHGLPATYDLAGLQSIHHHLFQDVYQWAGELRTVDMSKGGTGPGFVSFDAIRPTFDQITDLLRDTELLRRIPTAMYPAALARVYDALNTVHPFREGNGRTQREFVTALAGEAGYNIDWRSVQAVVNDRASEAALTGDLAPMTTMFERIVRRGPATIGHSSTMLPGAVAAAYPGPSQGATREPPMSPQVRPPRRDERGPDNGLSR